MTIYIPISHDEISSPIEDGLYVYDSESEEYVLSDDEIADSSIVYYIDFEDEDIGEEYAEYEELSNDDIVNPYEESLYEYYEDTEEYVPSMDTEPDPDKVYYQYVGDELDRTLEDDYYFPAEVEEGDNPSELGLYVYDDGVYVPTEDTSVDESVVYYEYLDPEDETYDEDYEEDEDEEEMLAVPTASPPISYENIVPESDGDYIIAFTSYYPNPSECGLYEYVNSQYVLSEDTETDVHKVYYQYVDMSDYREIQPVADTSPVDSGYFEYTNGEYVLSSDTAIVSGKHYYVYDPIFPEFFEYEDPGDDDFEIDPGYGVPLANEIEE